MFRCAKIRVMDLNPHLMCVLCGGYFIDATTVIECLHSFCRTCIVRYLESSKFCPICDVQVHKTRPLLNIRSDKTLQDLVYKLVPGLFEEEMRRRREFHKNLPEEKISHLSLEERGLAHMVSAHRLTDENISVVLELSNSVLRAPDISKRPAIRRKVGDRRYLLCPVEVSIGHLKKFIRLKFSLPQHYQIDVFCSHTDDEALSDDVTLLDISFIHTWSKEKPLRLLYSVYVKPRTKRRKKKAQQPDSKKTRTDGLAASDVTVDLKTKVVVSEVPATVTTPSGEDTASPVKAADSSQAVAERSSPRPQQESGGSLQAAAKDEGVLQASAAAAKEGSEARPADRPSSSRKSSTDSGSDSRTSFSDSRSSRSRTSSTDSKGAACSSDSRSVTSWSSSSSRKSSSKAGANGSRTNSPRPGGAGGAGGGGGGGGGGSRTASPRPQQALTGPKRTSSPHKPPGGSRTASPKPANCRSGGGAATVPSLPVGESISVDVSIGAGSSSSSEISPDVTSPGAEDRANSGAMAEVPGEFGRGDHVCNVAAAFPAKPAALHDLKAACAAGQQSQVKGGSGPGRVSAHAQSKEAAKVAAKGAQGHRLSPARTNGSARR